MTRIRPGLAFVLVGAIACRGRSPEPAASGEAQVRVQSFTHYGERTELFVEFEPFVAARASPMAAHLTALSDWKPLAEGKVVAVLSGGGGEERFEANAPSNPGIFRPEPKPSRPGQRRLTLVVTTAAGTDRHELGDVVVYATPEEAAKASSARPPEPAGLIPFLMEQQWKTEFGTATAVERTLRTSVLASGALRPRSEGEAHVAAPTAGRLLGAGKGFPRVGMEVKKDQLLAVLAPRLGGDADPATLELAVSQAKLRLDYARRDRERLDALLTQQAVPERRVIEARQGESLAAGELAAASRRLAQFQGTQRVSGAGASGRVELRAPVAGVVASVGAAPGAFVEEGRELFHVVDLDRLWLEVQIPEADIGRIGTPSGAAFEIEGFDGRREVSASTGARLVAFGGVVDPQTRTTPLIFEVPNPGRALRSGMFARVHVATGHETRGVAIPTSAVVDDGKQEVAFVQVNGEAYERRPLRLGIRDGDLVQVLEGLSPGERIVSRGAWQVRLASAAGALPAHGHVH
jgi:membrane fusion protein, heavy metal efflux system